MRERRAEMTDERRDWFVDLCAKTETFNAEIQAKIDEFKGDTAAYLKWLEDEVAKAKAKTATMRVAVYRVGEEMEVREIPATLEAKQAIVGGSITEATLADDLALICNDDGIGEGLPDNRTYRYFNGEMGLAFGDFFVCRVKGEDYIGLTDADIERLPSIIDTQTETTLNILLILQGREDQREPDE